MNTANGIDIKAIPFEREMTITTARSRGPGGQHVNKVNTKVELRFNIPESSLLTDEQKEILMIRLKTRITDDGVLIVIAQSSRSQMKNKEAAFKKFYDLLQKALEPVKPRFATQPTRASAEKRLESKRKTSQRKEQRKPPEL